MSSNIDTDSLPLVPGALAGVAAWALGYVFTYLLAGTDIRQSNLNQIIEFTGGESATYELVGWVFYNAHMVSITYTNLGPFAPPANFIGGEDGFTALLYVIPPALLVAAGLAISRYQGATETNDGAIAGALVVPGYLVLSIAGTFLFEVVVENATGGPDLIPAVFLAGIVYPVVFGAIGGAIGGATGGSDSGGL